jgi:hypothetical protein
MRRALPVLALLLLLMGLPAGQTLTAEPAAEGGFVRSETCRRCHPSQYSQWAITPHARMLMDAKLYPEAIRATITEEVPFGKGDIYFTVGNHWIQKYMTIIDGEFYILPKFWNVVENRWEPYSIFDWRQKTYTETCLGCHTVGFDPKTMTFAEEKIGCESCHGPGRKHTASEDAADIVNPAKLEKRLADMICEACHTDGDDKLTGKYPFPVGYVAGADLGDYYTEFFMPKPKSQRWFLGDGSYLDRHRMFLFFQSKFYSTTRACEVCGFDRGMGDAPERFRTRNEMCSTCHQEIGGNYVGHSRHTEKQAACADCHVPTVTADKKRYHIHDHKFDFSQPEIPCAECHGEGYAEKEVPKEGHNFHFDTVDIPKNLTLPEACVRCHEGKSLDWAEEQIRELKFRYRGGAPTAPPATPKKAGAEGKPAGG